MPFLGGSPRSLSAQVSTRPPGRARGQRSDVKARLRLRTEVGLTGWRVCRRGGLLTCRSRYPSPGAPPAWPGWSSGLTVLPGGRPAALESSLRWMTYLSNG